MIYNTYATFIALGGRGGGGGDAGPGPLIPTLEVEGAAIASSIAHRLSTIRGADRLVLLDRSSIVESGSHNQLLARDGLSARLYRMTYEPAAPDGDGRSRDARREALRPT